jgi:hypothetical protein
MNGDEIMKVGLFGTRPVPAVTLVETPVSRSYARKARMAFFATVAVSGLVTLAVLLASTHPAVAVLLALLIAAVCGLVMGLLVRVWPLLRVFWWWAAELVAAVLLVAGLLALVRVTHPAAAVAVVLAVAGAVGLVGPVRRRVVAWSWCVIARHRLRLCFAEFIRSANRMHPGCLPLILWARPTPAGERVWVWLRPGLDLDDLEGRTGKLAVACWAGEVRVVRASARYAALVRVDVARRDPLTGLVPAPLASLVPRQQAADTLTLAAVPPLGLDLADVPEPLAPEPRTRR